MDIRQGDDEMEKKIIVKEQMTVKESAKIEVYQSASLVLHTKRLSEMTGEQINELDRNCLASATVLMGAAALEALFAEVVYVNKPDLYTEKFLHFGFKKKIKKLKGKKYLSSSKEAQEASELWEYRKAIAHSEPINDRSTTKGKIINPEGAKWVYKTVEEFARIIWDSEIPEWFSETTGIR